MDVYLYYFIHITLAILVISFFVLVITLVLNRFRYDLSTPKINEVKDKVDDFLTTLVFSCNEADFPLEIKRFKKQIPFKKKWCKKIILNRTLFLKQNLKGEVSKTFHLIYEEFGLFDFTVSLIKSNKWYLNCIGMHHLEALDYVKGKEYVLPFINHKKRMLNSSAYLTLISLDSKSLDLLIDFSGEILLAGEINIMNFLHQRKPQIPSNLKDWIHSKNPTVIRLGIKFMTYYNYTNENEGIINHLTSDNVSIRNAAISAVKQLFIFEAEQTLIEQFEKEDTKNKHEILNTLSVIGSEDSQKFLSGLFTQSIDSNLKLEAVSCLFRLNPDYFEHNFTDNPDIIKMVKHVKTTSP